uniref:RNA helicase n=1 Tax=Stomoxys calcitrans TaxID=35570 RepID=A0A1I8Q043_STOCA
MASNVIKSVIELNLREDLLEGVIKCGYKFRLIWQRLCIKHIAEGCNVILQNLPIASSPSTIAISALQMVDVARMETQVLYLSSSDKLSRKLQNVIQKLGISINRETIMCGTPESILEMINRNELRTTGIRLMIMDDVMSFIKRGISPLVDCVCKYLPADIQVLMISNQVIDVGIATKYSSRYPVKFLDASTTDESQEASQDDERNFVTNKSVSVVNTFEAMKLNEKILKCIASNGFEIPKAVQCYGVPFIIEGGNVVIVSGPQSGKTTTAAISILQTIDTSCEETQVLYLSHTREEATKCKCLLMSLSIDMNVNCFLCIGGTNIACRPLPKERFIVCGTPGRVLDMIERKIIRTSSIRTFVLDDAHLLLRGGIIGDLDIIFNHLPPTVQIVMISSRMSLVSIEVARIYVRNSADWILPKRNERQLAAAWNTQSTNETVVKTSESVEIFNTFASMKLKEKLLESLAIIGYRSPLPAQRYCIKPIIDGRNVTAVLQSRTGKTTTIAMSVLHMVDTSSPNTQIICLSHNRGLAIELENVIRTFGSPMEVKCCVCDEVEKCLAQTENFANQHIVCGTPEFVWHHIEAKRLQTTGIRLLVLDDANVLFNKTRLDAVNDVFRSLPVNLQVVIFSNEMSSGTMEVATEYQLETPLKLYEKRCSYPHGYTNGLPIVKEQVESVYTTSESVEALFTFKAMHLKQELLEDLTKVGFHSPLSVQRYCIQPIIGWRNVTLVSEAGSGKTIALAISMLQIVDTVYSDTQILCLSHSYSAALKLQIAIRTLGTSMNVRCCVAGVGTEKQTFANHHIVCGTPLVIRRLIQGSFIKTNHIALLVLGNAELLIEANICKEIDIIYRLIAKDVQTVITSAKHSSMILNVGLRYQSAAPIRIEQRGKINDFKENGYCEFQIGEPVQNFTSFESMNLKDELLRCLIKKGITTPMDVQRYGVRAIVEGKCCTIESGPQTGKTTAVAISILEIIDTGCEETQVLCVCHSQQECIELKYLVQAFGVLMNVTPHLCIAGKGQFAKKLIVCGTPGQLLDLMNRNIVRTSSIRTVVLDDANRLMNAEMIEDVGRICRAVPLDTQVVMISEHLLTSSAMEIAANYLPNSPIRIIERRIGEEKQLNPRHFDKVEDLEFDTSEPVEVSSTFEAMGLKEDLIRGLLSKGFKTPLALQRCCMKILIEGHDVILSSQAGSGKTTAIAMSLLQMVDTSRTDTQVLYVTHSQEVAVALQNTIRSLGKFMNPPCKIFACTNKITNQQKETAKLLVENHQIVCGTSKQINVMKRNNILATTSIRIIVLDDPFLLAPEGKKSVNRFTYILNSLPRDTQILICSHRVLDGAINVNEFFPGSYIIVTQKRMKSAKTCPTVIVSDGGQSKGDVGLKSNQPSDSIEILNHNLPAVNSTCFDTIKPKRKKRVFKPTVLKKSDVIEFETSQHVEVWPSFNSFRLNKELLEGINICGFKTPLPVQIHCLKPLIKRRHIIINSQVGSGKTTAIVISILQSLDISRPETQVLCLTLTPENALEIQTKILALDTSTRVRCSVPSTTATSTNPHIICGVPEHVSNMITSNILCTTTIRMLVLFNINLLLSEKILQQFNYILSGMVPGVQIVMTSTHVSFAAINIAVSCMQCPIIIKQNSYLEHPEDHVYKWRTAEGQEWVLGERFWIVRVDWSNGFQLLPLVL